MKPVLAYFMLAIIVLGGFYLTYLHDLDGLISPPLTFYVDSHNFQTDQATYHRGDTVYIHTSFCRNRAFEAKSSWYLVDHTKISFPDTDQVLPQGCVLDKMVAIGVVPAYAPLGLYHLEGASAVKVNNLSTVYYNYKSIDFSVI